MRISLRFLLLCSLLLLFGVGCAARVRNIPGPVVLPESFRATGEETLMAEWWRDFDDPALDSLMDLALAENFNLRSAWDRLSQAEAQARIAGADLFPEVTGNARAEQTWRREEVTSSPPVNGMGQTEAVEPSASFEIIGSDEYSAGLVADYELDLWGRVRSLRNAAILDTVATAEDLRAAAVTLTANVASTWYQLQEQQAQLMVLQRQVDTTSSTLQLIESRFRRGISQASDVLQQRQLLESRLEELQRAELRSEILRITLGILLGRSPGVEAIWADGALIALPELPVTGIPSEVILERPDVRAAYVAVQAADQRVGAAIANRYPRVSFSASINSTTADWQGVFDNWLATIAANIAAPIFDGGARRAEVTRTQARTMELFHNYGQALIEAVGEVEQALVNERRQRLILGRVERQLDLADQVTDRIRAQYLSGTIDYLRVLEAQQSQHSLEREMLTVRRELIGFRIDLCRALSAGWVLEDRRDVPDFITERDSAYPLPVPLPGENL